MNNREPPTLTTGAIHRIMQEDADIHTFHNGLDVQLESFKKIAEDQPRLRLRVTDGQTSIGTCMSTEECGDKIERLGVKHFAVIRLKQYNVGQFGNRKILIIGDFELLANNLDHVIVRDRSTAANNGRDGSRSAAASAAGTSSLNNASAAASTGTTPTKAISQLRTNDDTTPKKPGTAGSSMGHPTTRGGSPATAASRHSHHDETPPKRRNLSSSFSSNTDAAGGSSSNKAATNTQNSPQCPSASSSSNNSNKPANTFPISSLTPFQNRWKIRGKVIRKGDMYCWSNARGEGRVFSFTIADESGEVPMKAFNAAADKFVEEIVEGGVYDVSAGTVKAPNPNFKSPKHDYEVHLSTSSKVEPCLNEDVHVATNYNFVTIDHIPSKPVGGIIDIMAIVQYSSGLGSGTSQKGKPYEMCRLTLIDDTNSSIELTLWDADARSFSEKTDNSPHAVLCVNSCRIGTYNGLSLSMTRESRLEYNPNHPRAHKLAAWWDDAGRHLLITGDDRVASLTTARTLGDGGSSSGSLIMIGITEANNLGIDSDKTEYFNVRAACKVIDESVYKACPIEGCKKKLLDAVDGNYRCEKCNRSYDNYIHKIRLKVELLDFSGAHLATVFNDEAEAMLGRKAEDIGKLEELKGIDDEKTEEYGQIFHDVLMKTFIFRIAAKKENYNDAIEIKWTVQKVQKDSSHVNTTIRMLDEGIALMKSVQDV